MKKSTKVNKIKKIRISISRVMEIPESDLEALLEAVHRNDMQYVEEATMLSWDGRADLEVLGESYE